MDERLKKRKRLFSTKKINTIYKKKISILLLIIVCFAGLATDQMIIVVSKEPLATSDELGDHATLFTLALWKPHSLLCAG